MTEIEARAAISFSNRLGEFRAGKMYRLDGDDSTVQALVGVGYFIPTQAEVSDGRVDLVRVDEFLDSGVGVRRKRPPKRPRLPKQGELSDGTVQSEPDADQSDSASPYGTSGVSDGAGHS